MFASEVDGAVQNPQVVWLVGHMAVLLHVQLHAGPIGVDLAVLLDEDIVQNVVGDAVVASLHDGGIGKGLVVGHVQALILEVEAVAHPAAVQPLVGELLLQILKDLVVLLFIEVLRSGLGVVVAELDGDAVGQEALHVIRQLLGGVVLIQHAVDAGGGGDAAHYLVRGLLHVLHQMAGDVDAGDLVPVALREGDHLVGGVFLLHGEGGVDKNSVGVGNGVQHLLEGSQICQGLAAGKDEVTAGRDLIHGVDAAENGIQTEAGAVGILLFVDAEGAVIVAVVGNKDGDSSAAFPCLIGIAHIVQASLSK